MSDAVSNRPVLEIDDVSISYGSKKVIDSLSLKVSQGETFGLIGLNGVGKTTLIKAVLGLRDYQGGLINIQQRSRNHPESKKQIAFLPERFEPPWFLSGLEFLRFSMSLYRINHPDAYINDYSARLALDPQVLKNRMQTYSKGMRQKLGILATLLTGCRLLILDEPMSGLDPRARTLVKDLLQEARSAGRTIFFSSHILADMNDICDRVAVLDGGKLVFTGTPEMLKKEGGNDNMERAFLNLIEK